MEHTPVEHTTTERDLGRLPSGRTVAATLHRYVGGEGPTVYLQAGQHGIELNGPAALRRLHDRLTDAELAGTVLVAPLVNPLAFDHRSYPTPAALDALNPNLNRVWPGDPDGSLQERMAAALWDLVTDADAVVDLHTGTAEMLTHVRYRAGDDAARRLAAAFGTEYLLADPDGATEGEDGGDRNGDGGDRNGDRDGTEDGEPDESSPAGKFRTAAARAGVPAVTVELSNSRTLSHAAVESGVDGLVNVLRHLDLLPGPPAAPPAQTVLRDDAASTTAGDSGLFELRPDLSVGDAVEAGEELGTLYSPASFERLERVTVEESGVAYSLTREGTVVAGERLAAVAPRD